MKVMRKFMNDDFFVADMHVKYLVNAHYMEI